MEIMEDKSNEDMLIFNRFRIKMRSNLFRIKVTEIKYKGRPCQDIKICNAKGSIQNLCYLMPFCNLLHDNHHLFSLTVFTKEVARKISLSSSPFYENPLLWCCTHARKIVGSINGIFWISFSQPTYVITLITTKTLTKE